MQGENHTTFIKWFLLCHTFLCHCFKTTLWHKRRDHCTNFFFRYDIGEMALDWLCVKILAFDWLREMFDVTLNFRHVASKKMCLLIPLGCSKYNVNSRPVFMLVWCCLFKIFSRFYFLRPTHLLLIFYCYSIVKQYLMVSMVIYSINNLVQFLYLPSTILKSYFYDKS